MPANPRTDDFFGVGMLSANPYAARYQPVHDMQIATRTAQKEINTVNPGMPRGWDNMFSGTARGTSAPPSGPGGNAPTDYRSYIRGLLPSGPASPQALASIEPQLRERGITLQRDSSGDVRGRLYLPGGGAYDNPVDVVRPGGWGHDWTYEERNGKLGYTPGGVINDRPGGGGDRGAYPQSGNIPPDLAPLRGRLQGYFMDALNAEPGSRWDPVFSREDLTLQMDPSWGRLNGALYGALGESQGLTREGFGWMRDLMGSQAPQAALSRQLSGTDAAMMALLGMGSGGVNAISNPLLDSASGGVGMSALRRMALTGGRGDINPALSAISKQGMLQLEDTLAQIREQYGAMGLGAGSDVSDALARGASRGVADIIRQQSELAAGLDSQAQQRILQAGGAEQDALSRLLGTVGQLRLGEGSNRIGALSGVGNLAGTSGQLALGNASLQGQHLDRLFGGANSFVNNPIAAQMAQLTPGLSLYPQESSRLAEANLGRWYDEVLRQAGGPPILGMATGYATNFPPIQPPYHRGSSGWPGALGALGGGLISILPWLMGSDRNTKEDIVPATNMLDRLKTLPMYTWRYKGDSSTHIGPMAQDFQKTFGVGDGKTIFIPDLINVIMGSVKELAHATT